LNTVRLSCLLLLSVAVHDAYAASANEARARALYEKGRAQFDAHDYTSAIASWDQGYQLSPRPLFRFNIAQALRKLSEQHPDDLETATKARDEYRRYIDTSAQNEPERVDALRHLMELEKKLGPKAQPSPELVDPATGTPPFVETKPGQPEVKEESSHTALIVTLVVVGVAAVAAGTGLGVWQATRCQASLGCSDARR
jgi:hypothetical protein